MRRAVFLIGQENDKKPGVKGWDEEAGHAIIFWLVYVC